MADQEVHTGFFSFYFPFFFFLWSNFRRPGNPGVVNPCQYNGYSKPEILHYQGQEVRGRYSVVESRM